MSESITAADRATLEMIVKALEAAWNAGDGAAFGAPFAPDADFVTVRAEHMRGREAIASGHAGIFRTIYAGSTTMQAIEAARLLRPDLALVHVTSVLDAPSGPLAGRHTALYSMVLERVGDGWQITAFHNTLQPPPRG